MNAKDSIPIRTPCEARAAAKAELSKKWYRHTVSVAAAARRLARRFGESVEAAQIAAYLHDIAKELPAERLRQLADCGELANLTDKKQAQPVLHAFAGARIACERYGITDGDILNAIRYHTTGRPGMSRLEMIIFVADFISADRRQKTAEPVRRRAKQSLELAAAEELRLSIEYLNGKKAEIVPLTLAAYDELKGKTI